MNHHVGTKAQKNSFDVRALLTLAAVSVATFLVPLDITVVAVALDDIAASTGADFESLQWILNGYALAFTAALLTGGAVADRFGRKRMLLIGAAAFALTSALCAAAAGPAMLAVFRIGQGVAGAFMLTAAMGVMAHRFQDETRNRAFAIWGVVIGAGFAFGPLLGGALLASLGWRSIFLLNVPLLTVVVVLVQLFVDESKAHVDGSIDYAGMALSAAALFAGVFALLRAPAVGWLAPEVWGAMLAAAIAGGLFVLAERRHRSPMLPLELLRNRPFAASIAVSLLNGASYYAVLVYLPLYFQAVAGESAVGAGMKLLPMTLPILFGAPVGGWLVRRVSIGRFLGIGMASIAAGLAALAYFGASSGPLTSVILALVGISNGIINAQMTAAVIGFAPQDRAGLASGMASMSRHAGFAFGIALLGLVLAWGIETGLKLHDVLPSTELVERLAAGSFNGLQGTVSVATARVVFSRAIHIAIGIAAGLAALASALSLSILSTEDSIEVAENAPSIAH